MTPKQKAKELVGKFYINIPLRDCDNRRPHKYALIAVDEVLQSHYVLLTGIKPFTYNYWQEVKEEINRL